MITGIRRDARAFLAPTAPLGRRGYLTCHVVAMVAAAWHLVHPSEGVAIHIGTAVVAYAASKRLRDLGLQPDISLLAGALFLAAWHARGFESGSVGIFVILTLHMTATYLLAGLRPGRTAGHGKPIRSNA